MEDNGHGYWGISSQNCCKNSSSWKSPLVFQRPSKDLHEAHRLLLCLSILMDKQMRECKMRHWSYPARMCRKPISCGKASAFCFSFNISCHYWTPVLPRSVLHESLARQCQLYLINKACIYRFNDVVKAKVSSGVTRTSNLHIRCQTTISCWKATLPANPEGKTVCEISMKNPAPNFWIRNLC